MKKFVINMLMKYIKNNKQYSDEELEVIEYGISNLYLQITKTIVITAIAIILKIFIPYLIFLITYNIIRMPSFGIHAKKSWQCWVSSIILFNAIPYLITIVHLNEYIKIILLCLTTIYITYYSPADTVKRPIISARRRKIYKCISCIISLIYSLLCLYIKDQIIANAFLFSLILQCFIISPFTYKIFGLPYNNYKNYIREEA